MVDTVFQFGDYRLDCGRFELYRSGNSLKLEKKPMELLILLAAREGQLVTRIEIAERLWDSEVFVDTEHGINTAVRKIRQVLRDDPQQPRFLQTVTGKGYRFVGATLEVPTLLTGSLDLPLAKSSNPFIAGEAAPSFLPPDTVAGNAELPPVQASHPRSRMWRAVLGALAAVVFLIVVLVHGPRRWGNRFGDGAHKSEISSLAVLPLDNFSGDPGQEYLADGMTDELITMLAKNSTLRIVSRTSVMQYKGVHRPLPEIARALGVDGVLEGSVERSGNTVHMTIQLIEAPSDTHIWAETYDRQADDAVSLPREAAQTIAKQLGRTALHPAPARSVLPAAHDAYLRGRYLWFSDHNFEAGTYFRKAIELQPDYALGWSGLSIYYLAGAISGEMKPSESLAPGEAAAVHAVALDESLPEAHLALSAAAFISRWNWAQAEQEATRAIELEPKYAEAYHLRAKIFSALNRHQEAIDSQKIATELDPFTKPWAMTMALREARQYDAATNELRQRLEGNPQNLTLRWWLYDLYRRRGVEGEAATSLEKELLLEGDKVSAECVRREFQHGGYQAVLRWQLADQEKQSSTQYVSPYSFALFNAQLGRREKALSLLEQSYREHSPVLLAVQNDPAFDFLHSDERYRAIIKGIGLPPAY